jgi:transposase
MSNLHVIDVDIGKDVFHLVGFDDDGKVVLRRMIGR